MKHFNIYLKFTFFALISISSFACSDSGDSLGGNIGEGIGGSMARFTINGDHLYTVDNQKLKTFDLSIPDQPQHLSSKDLTLGFGIETIFSKDTLLYIGSQDGMYIYNVTRPDFPQQISMVRHIRSCDPVVVSGNYAYVTLNSENRWCGNTSNILNIYDVSNPWEPTLVHTENDFIHPRGLGVDNKKLLV